VAIHTIRHRQPASWPLRGTGNLLAVVVHNAYEEDRMSHVQTAEALSAHVKGAVFQPEDPGWDDARAAWNLAVDQRPAAVACPVDEDDVAAVIAHARERGLRVAPQGTGHNAGPLGSLGDSILLRTGAMRGVEVDAERRVARVRAGDLWQDVMGPVAEQGLTALCGSSPDVGIVGYSLGGGMGWLARKYGLQCNSVTAAELVLADGSRVRCDRDHEAELFWALRGGGGSFGVVTAIEFALYPIAEVYGGALVWDWHESERVLARWAEWAPTAPEEITTSARILQLPPLPEIPEPLRGRKLVMIDGAYAGDAADAEVALAPLRELAPEIDMFGPMPSPALAHLHGDPENPVPAASGHALLGELPADAVSAFVQAAGPGSGSPLLAAELRQLGGALARVPEEHGALARLDAAYALFAVGIAPTPEIGAAVAGHAQALAGAMAPWATGTSYLNFAEVPTDVRSGYDEQTYARLRAVRTAVDPDGLIHANHPIDACADRRTPREHERSPPTSPRRGGRHEHAFRTSRQREPGSHALDHSHHRRNRHRRAWVAAQGSARDAARDRRGGRDRRAGDRPRPRALSPSGELRQAA
jgi:FAD/FMN-containing dehydrogenase